MLTVASPKVSRTEIALRGTALRRVIEQARAGSAEPAGRVSVVHGLPATISPEAVHRPIDLFARQSMADGMLRDARVIQGPGFVGVDASSEKQDEALAAYTERFIQEHLRASEMHPDAWSIVVVRDPREIENRLGRVVGDRYSYRELDDFTDLIARTLKTIPQVSKVERTGLLEERIFLDYSQERLASYGITPSLLPDILGARNITVPGGVVEVGDKNLTIDPSGEFASEREIGDTLIPTSNGSAAYLRDLVDVNRAYVSPPRFLNFFGRLRPDGGWERSRAVTLSIQMRSGEKIGGFAQVVDAALDDLRQRLPDDLVLARTSDQPRQVSENIDLFMGSLYEAVVLVVLVSLIGFWEWRSAVIMALSIPIALAMTFGMMHVMRIDLQQVSIASLIIALGLLVDDPVVAGDAIKRELAAGRSRLVGAWLGPTKLATAIMFATITNIVAYLPFLFLSGDTGTFLYSLPVVITCSLVASRIVSMTFIPLLGYYLLRPKREPTIHERRQSGFAARYYRIGRAAIAHRWAVLAGSLVFLALGGLFMSQLKSQFFPHDHSYLSYVDIWLPEDAPLSATRDVADQVERVIRGVAADYGKDHPESDGRPRPVLRSLTTFLGGGGPRFWFSVAPEQSQLNYAQVVVEVFDKHDTAHLVDPWQAALDAQVAGARVDTRKLETGPPVGIPVSIRLSGEDIPTLRALAAQVSEIFRDVPIATRIRDNWGAESFAVRLKTDPDRANLAGVTNFDVAGASAVGMNGMQVASLREGDERIPVVARLRMEERAQLGDIQNLYVYSSQSSRKVPLGLVSSIDYGMHTEKLQRRNQFRTITVSAFPTSGSLPSEVLEEALPALTRFERTLPPGYRMEIGGEHEEQVKGFFNLAVVMAMSIGMIFLALVVQFRHAVKPLIVFAAIPYGMVGAFAALWVMNAPFGFMAFLGIASLVGVIVSHIIVLFDFIEEMHERGEPLEEALLDAGIVRLRPVLITVAATVIALFPLAAHGGPLWEPMCYAQIGGLTVATFVTLLLVPVLYATFVIDLRLVKWGVPAEEASS